MALLTSYWRDSSTDRGRVTTTAQYFAMFLIYLYLQESFEISWEQCVARQRKKFHELVVGSEVVEELAGLVEMSPSILVLA